MMRLALALERLQERLEQPLDAQKPYPLRR